MCSDSRSSADPADLTAGMGQYDQNHPYPSGTACILQSYDRSGAPGSAAASGIF